MREFMKYISDDYQEVIKLEEDSNGEYTIDDGFLPLMKIEHPDEDESTEYVAVKLILGDEAIQFQMLPADHGEESNGNIRIISILDQSILLFDNNLDVPTSKIETSVSWMLDHLFEIDKALDKVGSINKYGFMSNQK